MSIDTFEVNGVRVVNIKNKSEIAFFGIGVLAGSIFESPPVAGIAHYAEHMFFKGTKKRNWKDILEEFGDLGVNANAFTDRTEVLYHITCPKYNIEPVIDLLTDMFFHSTFPEEELEKERTVILEEMKMYEDDPKMAFADQVPEQLFTWSKGHNIIGTEKSVKGITRADMCAYLNTLCNPQNFIMLCCGDIDTEDLKKYLLRRIPAFHLYLEGTLRNEVEDDFWKPNSNGIICFERENITQSAISMFTDYMSADDDDYMAGQILLNAMGGGWHSKLFVRIREELGLCYSVGMSSQAYSYPKDMVSEIFGYTSPKNVPLFMEESEKVLDDTLKNGLDEALFNRSKVDYIAFLLRKQETSVGRAMSMVRRYLMKDFTPPEDVIAEMEAVTLDDCNRILERVIGGKRQWAIMNPID